MIFLMKFVRDMTVSPSDLSKDLRKIIKLKLLEHISGMVHPEYGYFIKIIKIYDNEVNNGLIMEGSGDIIFKLKYDVLVMRPFEGEVAEGIIENVLEEGGFHAMVGPMIVFISKDDISERYVLDKKNLCYKNEKNDTELKKGTKIRFRYKATQFTGGEFKPTGTIRDNYLGYIED